MRKGGSDDDIKVKVWLEYIDFAIIRAQIDLS